MSVAEHALQIILHLNLYLAQLVQSAGYWVYLLIFAIIFCETGLVIAPFLPGDSLLFAAGSIAAISILNPNLLFALVVIAAFAGDNCNYWIGHFVGARIFKPHARFFNSYYLEKTHHFYEKHGWKAIFLARYVPLLRTFVPFVAGIGRMYYPYYLLFSFLAATLWSGLLIYAGYFFGNIPFVQKNFSLAILLVIAASISPALLRAIIYFLQKRLKS